MNEYDHHSDEHQEQETFNYTHQLSYNEKLSENVRSTHDTAAPKIKERHKKRKAAVTLCCALLSGIIGASSVLIFQKYGLFSDKQAIGNAHNRDNTAFLEGIRENSIIESVRVNTGELLSASEVYAANVNSTVGITTSITTNFWGYQSTSAASGSGFIISEDGYILTNYHVIEASDRITVALFNGQSYEARVVGCDESNDIALLRIDAVGLSPVIFGDSDNTNVGDDVLAIGNPLGELTFSLTSGKISAKDREITFLNAATMNLMQTDCAINSGNSGGALFNMYGEVIGVTNAKYSSSPTGASIDNIGFAIPINTIRPIVDSIIEKGYVSKPYIGVTLSDVVKEYLIYGLPEGASVQSIESNSPAAEAGLQVGDIITGVDGKAIYSGNDLIKRIRSTAVGDQLKLQVYRKGNKIEMVIKVGERIERTEQTRQKRFP